MLKCFHLLLSIIFLIGLNIQKVFATDCDILAEALSHFDPGYKEKTTSNCCNEPSGFIKCNAQGQITELKFSDVSNGSFSGVVLNLDDFFEELVKLEKLEVLELKKIAGRSTVFNTFPPAVSKFKSLKEFTFSDSEDLFGFLTLPRQIGEIPTLQKLNLSNNKFAGDIPTTIGNLKSLISLNLSSNYFSGYVPYSFSNLVNLSELYLNGNSIHGYVPLLPNIKTCNYELTSLCNLSNAKCISGEDMCTEEDIKYANLENGNNGTSGASGITNNNDSSNNNGNSKSKDDSNSNDSSNDGDRSTKNKNENNKSSSPKTIIIAGGVIAFIVLISVFAVYKSKVNKNNKNSTNLDRNLSNVNDTTPSLNYEDTSALNNVNNGGTYTLNNANNGGTYDLNNVNNGGTYAINIDNNGDTSALNNVSDRNISVFNNINNGGTSILDNIKNRSRI